ncbi:MAG: hypothetical protein E4G99_08090 [Anaerolineales bacterium]|nr:MAG: hypothetical protein E4G99_08090 [Anaerolineales bacterium]
MPEESIVLEQFFPLSLISVKDLEVYRIIVLVREPIHDGGHLNSMKSTISIEKQKTRSVSSWDVTMRIRPGGETTYGE